MHALAPMRWLLGLVRVAKCSLCSARLFVQSWSFGVLTTIARGDSGVI